MSYRILSWSMILMLSASPALATETSTAPQPVNQTPVMLHTQLVQAILNDDIERVKQLIEAGAPANGMSDYRLSPLAAAVAHQKLQILDYLIRIGADVNAEDQNGHTALYQTLSQPVGYEPLIASLLKAGAKIDAQDLEGNSLLLAAAANGHANLVKHLLELGAAADLRNREGDTALYQAFLGQNYSSRILETPDLKADYLLTADYLLEHGASLNATSKKDPTLLQLACNDEQPDLMQLLASYSPRLKAYMPEIRALIRAKHYVLVESLLTHGFNPDIRDPNGNTQLMAAAEAGQLRIAKHLMTLGADPLLKNSWGQTALNLAISNHQGPTVRLLLPQAQTADDRLLAAVVLEDFQVLEAHFAKLDASSPEWFSVLGMAAHQGSLPILIWAKNKGQSLDIVDSKGNNLLSFALIGEKTDTFIWLLDQGLSPHLPNKAGVTVAEQVKIFNAKPFEALIDAP